MGDGAIEANLQFARIGSLERFRQRPHFRKPLQGLGRIPRDLADSIVNIGKSGLGGCVVRVSPDQSFADLSRLVIDLQGTLTVSKTRQYRCKLQKRDGPVSFRHFQLQRFIFPILLGQHVEVLETCPNKLLAYLQGSGDLVQSG